jgi:hypothetical protein
VLPGFFLKWPSLYLSDEFSATVLSGNGSGFFSKCIKAGIFSSFFPRLVDNPVHSL